MSSVAFSPTAQQASFACTKTCYIHKTTTTTAVQNNSFAPATYYPLNSSTKSTNSIQKQIVVNEQTDACYNQCLSLFLEKMKAASVSKGDPSFPEAKKV